MSEDTDENFIKNMVEDDEPVKPVKRGRPPKNTAKTDEVFTEDDAQVQPCYPDDQGWTQYVLSKLRKNEFDQSGNPKSNGLRRVLEHLMGPIVNTRVNVIQPPNPQNGNWAVVTYTLGIKITNEDGVVEHREFTDASDANLESCPPPFNKHLTATATSKAAGRAIRQALQLYDVFVSEELLGQLPDENDIIDMDGDISSTQINGLNFLAKSINLDVMKFINADPKKQYKNIKEVSKEKAQKMLTVLQSWKRNRSLMNNKYKGYQENWQEVY